MSEWGTRPFAVFTAGAAGAGKSVLAGELLARFALGSLDADDITAAVAARRPGRPHWDSRPTALRLLDRWQAVLIARRMPLLINTTAANLSFVRALRGRLEADGYRVAMIFVEADLADCVIRNAARVHARPRSAVETTFQASRANRAALEALFPDFRCIINRSSEAAFRADIVEGVVPWLDRLGVVKGKL